MTRIRILLADDHAILRAGLKALLNAQADIQVVGEAATGDEAVRVAQSAQPDLVLMDISMGDAGGVAATREVLRVCPTTRVLMLTMHDDAAYVQQALDAGAAGYVLKRTAESELLAAIRAVQRGEVFLYPSVARVLIDDYLKMKKGGESVAPEIKDTLTAREREVLTLIAQGYSNHEIAEQLTVSVKTVETHKARIQEKLGLRTRAELVRYAMQRRLLK
ncbi:MAG: response regulator transcription factor [Chloroflexi bacterium]|nr:response regulator transcription factor [Chloroflexota bacterium]